MSFIAVLAHLETYYFPTLLLYFAVIEKHTSFKPLAGSLTQIAVLLYPGLLLSNMFM
jgi:hypothetical protein